MVKKNGIFHALIGGLVGAWIGHGIFLWWDYMAHPELYAMQSAPWYTGLLVHGVLTIAVVVLALAVKHYIKKWASSRVRHGNNG